MPSIKWTGKNLAEVKRLHKDVAHHPTGKDEDQMPRDWSQHADNLHVEVDGRTIVAALGDTITKDAEGNVTVEQTGKQRPAATGRIYGRTIDAEASDGLKGKGGAK